MTDRLSLRCWAYVNQLSEQDTQYDDGTYRSFDLVAGSFREQIRSTVKGMSVRPKRPQVSGTSRLTVGGLLMEAQASSASTHRGREASTEDK